ncbi:hypothetical protein RI129_005023 [Pyrocoelia pectoralis]|uniref:Methyltransferase type 11 domain-containing protein n=1 Tax=Pyrocoelia pectoralis TaxID=417401 RepID=A0AAN7VLZ7_9COLE
MKNLHEKTRPNLYYIQMDVFSMKFDDDSFSVIVDKGTLDALMPDDKSETREKICKYFKEIERVLKFGGRYICISLLQKHILDLILDYFPSHNWMFRVVRCYEAEKRSEEVDNSLPIFMVICTKFKALPQLILEANMGTEDKMVRLKKLEDVVSLIDGIQQAAFICSGLRRSNIGDQEDVSFDLYNPNGNVPRFSLHVVDIPRDHNNSSYAAFIVPQGREVEWMFSTSRGRKHLTKMTKYNRLAVITMHRGQIYNSLESVQDELREAVCQVAPSGFKGKILFLSLGSDVGKRTIQSEGYSSMSGKYIVEDVEISPKDKFRRLIYLSNQFVVQSEAKLKMVKCRNGEVKEFKDHLYLTCKHHTYMSIAAQMAVSKMLSSSLALIGLGGGGLCMFLRKFLQQVNITAIDIDSEMLDVAKTWFGFKGDNKLHVTILDGIEFIRQSAETGKKFNAILFDVDSKDTSIGMSCPPTQFLDSSFLDDVVKCLCEKGLLIINVVIRDESLRSPIMNDLRNKFCSIITYKLEEDLNEIIICSPDKYEKSNFVSLAKSASEKFDDFLAKNNVGNRDTDDITHFLENLQIHVTK